ncbi:MAG: membrane protein insertase YidC [Cyclobacteriaceae bacterium]|nr:membrane protein insertase YidC [Cyclobacteriaceae bacterium]
MDRNQAIGFILIALMFILYVQFFSEDTAPLDPTAMDSLHTEQPIAEQSAPSSAQEAISTPLPQDDSLKAAMLTGEYGLFSTMAEGTPKILELENELIKVSLSTKGGIIDQVWLKDFTTYNKQELFLITNNSSEFNLSFQDRQNRKIDLTDLYYKGEIKTVGENKQVVFTGKLNNGREISILYSLAPGKYTVDYSIRLEGASEAIASREVEFEWKNNIRHQEHDIKISRDNASVKYYTVSEDYDDLSERSTSFEEEELAEPVKWFSFKQKFFTSAIIAEKSFNAGVISTNVDPDDTVTVKTGRIITSITTADLVAGGQFTYYFGPNDFHILSDVTDGFNKNVNMGWPPVNLVNRWVIIPLFDLLNNFISNYGIIIIIMVIIIKLALSPLSYKSYLSMAKMKVLKPDLDEIKEKNKDDMQKTQKDQMKLYQQVGVNPLSGCVPVVLQMPILFAMFYFFPQSIHLRQQGFLWATDLSTYDSIATLPFDIPGYGSHVSLFVLLMTLSTILYTWSNNQMTTVQGPMKTFSYIMPLMFMFILNSFPAALSFYYFVSNLVTFGQQALIRRFVDEKKIRSVLDENRKRNVNKKKSKFQMRLEEAMKGGEATKKNKK